MFEMMVAKRGFCLERKLLENGRQALANLLERHSLPQARALMNGGICERLFTLAKQSLDLRDDPAQPSVLLCAGDIIYACRQLPPPPSTEATASSSAPAAPGASAIDLEAINALRAQVLEL